MAIDWKDMLLEARKRAGALGQVAPKLIEGFQAAGAAKTTSGALEPKYRELIAIAVAVTTRCDNCIAAHVNAARQAGVTEAELTDALATTIALNAGAAFAYSGRALEAFTQMKQA